jgi:hypothetical protein
VFIFFKINEYILHSNNDADFERVIHEYCLKNDLAQTAYQILGYMPMTSNVHMGEVGYYRIMNEFDTYVSFREKLLKLTGQCRYWY